MEDSREPALEGVDLEGMRAYLKETAVEFAVLFGSHARGAADESSDVDVALGFPTSMTDRGRFHLRNRIDAELQAYADCFVDVSDIESLPNPVEHAALRDGSIIVGEADTVAAFHERVKSEYETASRRRERDREEFIERLARGDT